MSTSSPSAINNAIVRLGLTVGEPAGIGPDLVVRAVQAAQCERQLVAIGDPQVLSQRAALLGLPLTVQAFDAQQSPRPNAAGEIFVSPLAVQAPVQAGRLNASNGQYVLQTLDRAIQLCQSGAIDAMVTAPIHKG